MPPRRSGGGYLAAMTAACAAAQQRDPADAKAVGAQLNRVWKIFQVRRIPHPPTHTVCLGRWVWSIRRAAAWRVAKRVGSTEMRVGGRRGPRPSRARVVATLPPSAPARRVCRPSLPR